MNTCGTCKHWIEVPRDPANLDPKAVRGECRQGPPNVTVVMGSNGQQMVRLGQASEYPQLPRDFPACSQHAPRIVE